GLPTDQGLEEWLGITTPLDEAGYSSYKLFRELGYPEPQGWEGVKGQPVKSAGVLDKKSKHLGDEKITQRSVAFIKKQAEAKKPFFVYVSLLQIHPPMGVHPDFAGKSGGGAVCRLPGRAGLSYRSDSRRDQGGGHRRRHNRRVQQRQRHKPAQGRG